MLRNSLYNVLGAGIRVGLSVLIIPLLIRLLGVQEYGLWTFISAVIGIAGLAEAGLSVSTTVFLSRDLARNENKKESIAQTLTIILGMMLLLATLAAVILWFTAPNIANVVPELSHDQYDAMVKALKFGGLVIWAQLLQQVFIGIEQAYQNYGLINIINTLQVLLINLGMLKVAWLGGQTKALVQWQAAVSLLILIVHFAAGSFLLKGINMRLIWDRTKTINIARYSLTTWLGSIGITLFSKADRLLVGALLGANSLGIYSAITSISAQINSFSAVAIQPLLPLASKRIAEARLSDPALKEKVKQSLEINILLALGVGGLLIGLTPEIIGVMIPGIYSSRYMIEFYTAVMIYTLYSLNAVGYYILLSLGLASSFTSVVLISGSISLVLIAVGSHTFGLIGAIAGNSGYLLVWLLTLRAMRKLEISSKIWMGWLKFPLACFFVFSSASNVTYGLPTYRILILAIYLIVLVLWFKSVQRKIFQCLSETAMKSKTIYNLLKIQLRVRQRILFYIYQIRCIWPAHKLSTFSLIDGSRFDYPLKSAIGLALFCGGFETAEAKFLQRSLKSGDVFLDVGANGGFFTIIAANKVGENGHVYAFEPGQRELELLRHNIKVNNLANVSIIERAVSNKSGVTQFALSQDGAMNSMAENAHPSQKIEEWQLVQTISIDDFVKEYRLSKVDFMKVDVEGAERLVFEGCSETLSLNQKIQIMFESSDLNAVGFGYSVKEFLEEILNSGMELYYFDEISSSLVKLKSYNHQLGKKIYNFLAKRS